MSIATMRRELRAVDQNLRAGRVRLLRRGVNVGQVAGDVRRRP